MLYIIKISNILDTHHYLISFNSKQLKFHLICEAALLKYLTKSRLYNACFYRSDWSVIWVKSEELHRRCILSLLNHSLQWLSLASIKELNKIVCCNCDSIAVCICFIERISHASFIVHVEPSVLHKLNSTVLDYRSSLGTIIHYYKLHLCLFVNNRNGRLSWVKIRSDVCATNRNEVISISIVSNPFLHF